MLCLNILLLEIALQIFDHEELFGGQPVGVDIVREVVRERLRGLFIDFDRYLERPRASPPGIRLFIVIKVAAGQSVTAIKLGHQFIELRVN